MDRYPLDRQCFMKKAIGYNHFFINLLREGLYRKVSKKAIGSDHPEKKRSFCHTISEIHLIH